MATRYVGGPILRYGGKVRLAEEMASNANTTTKGARQDRREVLWTSYPAEFELGAQSSLDLSAAV